MIRVDIETIVMAAGPHPSLIVLRERETSESNEAPPSRPLHPDRVLRGRCAEPGN